MASSAPVRDRFAQSRCEFVGGRAGPRVGEMEVDGERGERRQRGVVIEYGEVRGPGPDRMTLGRAAISLPVSSP
ncbi:hypothetical protein SSPO_100420 [Streptomyces antimycoticus]|uniref:Uncharacterized protein n=1 Tax=Streptomyces antimycoticus TaxID=68175 RepID=A0A499UZA9_9ACTN|nr:hypothetical protein SSPO_100420 [Streptomyces antimycoticus]